METPRWFKPGARCRARWVLAGLIPKGALGRIHSVDKYGYAVVKWDDESIQSRLPKFILDRGIHFEHLTK